MGANRLQLTHDRFKHCIGFFENLRVPKPNDAITERFHKTISSLIVCALFLMLTAVKLNDELCINGYKIRNIATDRNLSTKSITTQLSTAQTLPEKAFGVSGVISENSAAALCNPVTHAVNYPAFAPTLALPRTSCRGGKQST